MAWKAGAISRGGIAAGLVSTLKGDQHRIRFGGLGYSPNVKECRIIMQAFIPGPGSFDIPWGFAHLVMFGRTLVVGAPLNEEGPSYFLKGREKSLDLIDRNSGFRSGCFWLLSLLPSALSPGEGRGGTR